jgi:hypothetical protein
MTQTTRNFLPTSVPAQQPARSPTFILRDRAGAVRGGAGFKSLQDRVENCYGTSLASLLWSTRPFTTSKNRSRWRKML